MDLYLPTDLMGYTFEDVQMFETMKDTPRHLLYDWSTSKNGTIAALLELLAKLERYDTIELIETSLVTHSN